ncbi:MAG: hydrogen peroxide-dependent heme synthase [Bryobacteraceae bacterium]|jgi:chlorite dismutase
MSGVVDNLPAAPLTLEGASVLHQMFRIRWPAWKALAQEQRAAIAAEAARAIEAMERDEDGPSAIYSLIGHKGDLLLLHFRKSFEELNRAELRLARLRLADFLEPATSYLSVVELGLYDSSIKLYRTLAQRGIEPHSPEWSAEVESLLAMQRKAMHPRLYPKVPPQRYLCFYPMDRKRGEEKNFYTVPIAERGRMMREHGLVGRRYSDRVQQIVTGSIGFDDWEWGVDLFADDPLEFKKLIYEMRFDEVSAVYALFGSFYLGVRVAASQLGALLDGNLP